MGMPFVWPSWWNHGQSIARQAQLAHKPQPAKSGGDNMPDGNAATDALIKRYRELEAQWKIESHAFGEATSIAIEHGVRRDRLAGEMAQLFAAIESLRREAVNNGHVAA